MNWDALGAIGEIVGAAGVILSLLYLASQVRSNSRQLRHASAQAVLDKLNGLIGQLAFTAGAGDVWTRGLSGLDALKDDEELVRFSSMLLQAFWAYEEVLHYRRAGVIEDWAWTHARAPVEHFMRTPGFQEWWVLRKDWFGGDFQEFVSARIPESTGALVEDFKRPVQASQASAVAGREGSEAM
ncbi:MAG: hypothetical protein KAJ43_04760 [Gemmatimonadetes bacterium]|nr:hypothetical protein [Gemmatimonadota bacterium]